MAAAKPGVKSISTSVWGMMLAGVFLSALWPLPAGLAPVLAAGEDLLGQKELAIADGWKALSDPAWEGVTGIAVDAFVSIAFQTAPAHPFLAEYYQRLFVFGGDARNGRFLRALQMRANTGGRTHLLIYRHLGVGNRVTGVSFVDRYGIQYLKLPDVRWGEATTPLKAARGEVVEYVGLISAEASPMKFFAPLVYPESEAKKEVNVFSELVGDPNAPVNRFEKK